MAAGGMEMGGGGGVQRACAPRVAPCLRADFNRMKIGLYDCNFQSCIEFCSEKGFRSFAQGKLKTVRCKSEVFKGFFLIQLCIIGTNCPKT